MPSALRFLALIACHVWAQSARFIIAVVVWHEAEAKKKHCILDWRVEQGGAGSPTALPHRNLIYPSWTHWQLQGLKAISHKVYTKTLKVPCHSNSSYSFVAKSMMTYIIDKCNDAHITVITQITVFKRCCWKGKQAEAWTCPLQQRKELHNCLFIWQKVILLKSS